MRILIMSACALIVMAAQTQAMDWNTLSVNGNPVPPQATVSFSIGYPKGWTAIQNYREGWHDIYNGIVVAPLNPGPICSFGPPATTMAGGAKVQGHTTFFIWPSPGGTAAEAAGTFFNGDRSTTNYTHESMTPVRTSAGESGWLVESKGCLIKDPAIGKLMFDRSFMAKTNALDEIIQLEKNVRPDEKIPVIYHDYFFHSGNLGAIHIEIMTDTADSTGLSQLDDLVLNTLRFNSP